MAEHSYESLNRVTDVSTQGAAGNPLSRYTYALDAKSRKTGLTEMDGRSSQWTYDDTYHLLQENIEDPISTTHIPNAISHMI
ncbi:hypothetical protein P2G88_10055 [Aliiglaciecola sp. CAU 1673]|uniref:hypothetical protein n=1 Tax=Aliiglaciecola sp. CAU 1673 TaxID=3032595 RepID=UPI0023DA15E0|nr:hypothetical protein [Aliiglaciecola sp. CAU 1673]MDF2178591.1 hypothetical protein [Aliiglaciecola sp. CAU 1673]